MNHRIRIGAVIAAAVVSTLFVSPDAQAKDHRPCVSLREWRGAWKHDAEGVVLTDGYTRRQLEARWEVQGLGFPVDASLPLAALGVTGEGASIGYPRCGFSTDDAWFGATYEKRDPHRMMATLSHRVSGVQVNGHR